MQRERQAIDIPVAKVVWHDYFVFTSYANDIALLRLADRIEYTDFIQPICLPLEIDESTRDYRGETGTVVGWGRMASGGEVASALQQVVLPIIDNDQCMSWYQSQNRIIELKPTQFCAGFADGGKDACQGDSGGPMMMRNETSGQFVLIGIVSAGIGCALPHLPGLYTRVNAFLPWIDDNMKPKV